MLDVPDVPAAEVPPVPPKPTTTLHVALHWDAGNEAMKQAPPPPPL
jgi:hypothetical protein